MDWEFSLYVAVLIATAHFSGGVALLVLRQRDKPGGLPLGLLLLAVAEWSLALAIESAAVGIPAKIFWSKIEYVGIISSPALLVMFAVGFALPEKRLLRRHQALLWAIPIITLVLAWTNEQHHLIWTSFTPSPVSGSNTIIYGHGVWFWVFVTFGYLVLAGSTIAMISAAIRLRYPYRRQIVAILIAMVSPWVVNVLYNFELGPMPGRDLTPIGFALTGLMLTWSLGRHRLLDLVPVARDKIVEDMSDGMLVLDAQNRVVDINPAAQRFIGIDAPSAIGKTAESLLEGRSGLDVLDAQSEAIVDRLAGVEWRVSSLFGRDGDFSGRLITLRDISERVALEQLRDYLIDTMVHDLRNPLSNISTVLDMLAAEEGALSAAERRQVLEIAKNGARRMLMLVNSILDGSRLESDQMPLVCEPLHLGELVAEILQGQLPVSRQKNLNMLNKVPPDLVTIMADISLIGRVLQNLIDNAVKFTPEGGTIQVMGCVEPGGEHVTISVRDSGAGIPPELQSRLFQRFTAGRTPGRGTGIGLAFCRLAIEAHGGKIWVESQAGEGSMFTFLLPIRASQDAE